MVEAGPRSCPDPAAAAANDMAVWLTSAPGALLLEQEIQIASRLLLNLFGYHLVVVGSEAYAPVIQASRILHAAMIVPPPTQGCPVAISEAGPRPLVANPDSLPLVSDSVDVVVLPHGLEFTENPHAALREAERVLVGEGHLILTAFNPVGAMGLWRTCLRGRRGAPWSGHFFSNTRVKDWLALLGFDVLMTQAAMFRPPFQNARLLEKLAILEPIGSRMWPYLGATSVILAKKRITTATPIRPRWRRSRRLVSVGIAEPSARTSAPETTRRAEPARPKLVVIGAPRGQS